MFSSDQSNHSKHTSILQKIHIPRKEPFASLRTTQTKKTCRKNRAWLVLYCGYTDRPNREVTAPVKYLCGHKLDAPTFKTAGTGSAYLGESKKKYPCDDCKANGKWTEKDGKWVKTG